MNIKAFFVDALGAALELGIGTPDDVLRHVTPDVLAQHLPRPLWARLLAACLAAPRVDARLVVDTIGVPNLCEHIPTTIIWGCISEMGARSLGSAISAAPAAVKLTQTQPIRGVPTPVNDTKAETTRPETRPETKPETKPAATPAKGAPIGPNIPRTTPAKGTPTANAAHGPQLEIEAGEPPRAKTPTGQRFRQSNTGSGARTLGGIARRPQAAAAPVPAIIPRGSTPKRDMTDYESETAVESADWREKEIVVDDEQLVDWQADPGSVPTPIGGDDDFGDLGSRKR